MGDNRKYYYDLEAINNFIFGEDGGRNSSVEITEVQGLNQENGEMVTVQKTIREVKESNDLSNKETIRYDMIKLFIDMLSEEGVNGETYFSKGQEIIKNTMEKYNLLKEETQE